MDFQKVFIIIDHKIIGYGPRIFLLGPSSDIMGCLKEFCLWGGHDKRYTSQEMLIPSQMLTEDQKYMDWLGWEFPSSDDSYFQKAIQMLKDRGFQEYNALTVVTRSN